MGSAVEWLGALRRLQRRAFHRSTAGESVVIRAEQPIAPRRPWRRPELRFSEQERRVEFTLHVAGAEAESTRVYWSEETQTLTVHAALSSRLVDRDGMREAGDWYAEILVPSDVDAGRAEAFLKDGALRIIAPRVVSTPLTGLPLLSWLEPFDQRPSAATT